jgi:hypothetical protein
MEMTSLTLMTSLPKLVIGVHADPRRINPPLGACHFLNFPIAPL